MFKTTGSSKEYYKRYPNKMNIEWSTVQLITHLTVAIIYNFALCVIFEKNSDIFALLCASAACALFISAHWGRVTHICVSKLCYHQFK